MIEVGVDGLKQVHALSTVRALAHHDEISAICLGRILTTRSLGRSSHEPRNRPGHVAPPRRGFWSISVGSKSRARARGGATRDRRGASRPLR
jgi:hypothetical protein